MKRLLSLQLMFMTILLHSQRILTLDEAVQMGMNNSKALKADAAKIEATKQKTKQLWNVQIPNVVVSSNYTRLSDNIKAFEIPINGKIQTLNPQILNQYTNRVSAQQVLFAGLRAKNTFDANRFLEKAITFDVEKDKSEVKYNIIAALLNMYKIQKSLESIEQNLKTAQNRAQDTRNFLAQGIVLDNDVLKVELAQNQLETTKIELTNALAAAQYSVAILLGLPENETFSLDEKTLLLEDKVTDLSTCINAALQNRAELQAVTQRTNAAQKQIAIAKGAYLPTLSAGANAYYNNPNQRVFPQQDAFKGTWDAGLSLSWNLTSLYSNKAVVEEAKSNAIQTQMLGSQMTDNIKNEVSAAYYNYLTAKSKLGLTDKAIQQAQENQRIAKNRYSAQLSTTQEVLDADFLMFQSQINAVNANADKLLNYYKLNKSMGK